MILPSFDREDLMKRFVEGVDRGPGTLFPERLDEWIGEDNAVRVIDAFVDELDLGGLGFGRVEPEATGRPSYHPTALSTGFNRAGGWNGKLDATWKSCG